jgi:hypothetical protein
MRRLFGSPRCWIVTCGPISAHDRGLRFGVAPIDARWSLPLLLAGTAVRDEKGGADDHSDERDYRSQITP